MRRHFDKIVASSTPRLTNAIAEGLNRILKIIKNRASGYSNLKVYADIILLTVDDSMPMHKFQMSFVQSPQTT